MKFRLFPAVALTICMASFGCDNSMNKAIGQANHKQDSVKKTGNKNLRNSNPPKDKKNSFEPGNLYLYILSGGFLFLLAVTFLLSKKLKMMALDNDAKQKQIDYYLRNLKDLENYLAQHGIELQKLAEIKFENAKNHVIHLIDIIDKAEDINTSKNQELEQLREELKKAKIENYNLTKEASSQSVTVVDSVSKEGNDKNAGNYKFSIKAEVMISAGPRKDAGSNDTELGEDVAGTLSLPDKTFFWLLDGTSESAVIKSSPSGYEPAVSYLFSSRLLAQNIGYFIQKNLYAPHYENNFEILLADAVTNVSSEWTKRINSASGEKKEELLKLLRQGFKPLCSTTVIVGKFSLNGDLEALRTGDSKVFPFSMNDTRKMTLIKSFRLTEDAGRENDRVAFRLDFDEPARQFVITSNSPRSLVQKIRNIALVYAFSDGIGRVVEAQLSSNNDGIVEMIKENISRIPQKTYDDKSLIILERINR